MKVPSSGPDVPDDPDSKAHLREELERGVAEISTSGDAASALDSLEESAGELLEAEVATTGPDASPQRHAETIETIETVPAAEAAARAAHAIEEVAIESAGEARETTPIVDEVVSDVLGGQAEIESQPLSVLRGRQLLRQELIKRLHPLQAVDAFLFVKINQLPHPAVIDRSLSRLNWVMTGGGGYLILLAGATLMDRPRGWKATLAVVPVLWLATATVEHPIKNSFRRRRPFISLVQAIIVGRKPGSYSFPSGHSAAAFAGALLLARQYPKGAGAFFGLASVVAFSRIYLGAHYPGDVVSGSFLGVVLARVYSSLLRKIGLAPKGR